MKEISIQSLHPNRIGQTENREAGTGCTVILCEQGMRAGLDVRGGGPASRESQILNPLMAAQVIHAIVLAGGSAFGLGAANGVMEYLEERGVGMDVGVTAPAVDGQLILAQMGQDRVREHRLGRGGHVLHRGPVELLRPDQSRNAQLRAHQQFKDTVAHMGQAEGRHGVDLRGQGIVGCKQPGTRIVILLLVIGNSCRIVGKDLTSFQC